MGKGDLTPHLIQHQRKRLVNLPAVIADISGGDRIFRPRMSQALADGFRWYLAIVGCNTGKRITGGVGGNTWEQRMIDHLSPTANFVRNYLRGADFLQCPIPARCEIVIIFVTIHHAQQVVFPLVLLNDLHRFSVHRHINQLARFLSFLHKPTVIQSLAQQQITCIHTAQVKREHEQIAVDFLPCLAWVVAQCAQLFILQVLINYNSLHQTIQPKTFLFIFANEKKETKSFRCEFRVQRYGIYRIQNIIT